MDSLRSLASRKFVIFDLFHTLVSVDRVSPDTGDLLGVDRETYLGAVFSNADDRLTGVITDPVAIIADLARGANSQVPSAVYPRIAESRARRFEQTLSEVGEGILIALDALIADGKTLALISNADATEAAGWHSSPLAHRFTEAVFSCRVGLAKPNPAIYRYCLERIGATADDAVYVGDGGSDEFIGAREVGLPTVCTTEFISTSWPEKVEERKGAADCWVDSLAALVATQE